MTQIINKIKTQFVNLYSSFFCFVLSFNIFYMKYNSIIKIIYIITLLLVYICYSIEIIYTQDVPNQDTNEYGHRIITNFTSEELIKKVRDQAIQEYEDLKEKYENCTDKAEKEDLGLQLEEAQLHVEILQEECAKYDKPDTNKDSSSKESK